MLDGVPQLLNLSIWTDLIAHQEQVGTVRGMVRLMTAERRLAPHLRTLPLEGLAERFGGNPAPWFDEWIDHFRPTDPYWDRYRATPAVQSSTVPALLMGAGGAVDVANPGSSGSDQHGNSGNAPGHSGNAPGQQNNNGNPPQFTGIFSVRGTAAKSGITLNALKSQGLPVKIGASAARKESIEVLRGTTKLGSAKVKVKAGTNNVRFKPSSKLAKKLRSGKQYGLRIKVAGEPTLQLTFRIRAAQKR